MGLPVRTKSLGEQSGSESSVQRGYVMSHLVLALAFLLNLFLIFVPVG